MIQLINKFLSITQIWWPINRQDSEHITNILFYCSKYTHLIYSYTVFYGNIYHPPNTTKQYQESTIDHLVSAISQAIPKYPNAKICVAGDFNDLDTLILTDLLPFTQIVDFPTWGSGKLDLVSTDCSEYIPAGCTKERQFKETTIAQSLCHVLHAYIQRNTPSITKRDITPASKIALSRALENTDWTPKYRETSCYRKAEMLRNTVQALVDRHWPARQVSVLACLSLQLSQ